MPKGRTRRERSVAPSDLNLRRFFEPTNSGLITSMDPVPKMVEMASATRDAEGERSSSASPTSPALSVPVSSAVSPAAPTAPMDPGYDLLPPVGGCENAHPELDDPEGEMSEVSEDVPRLVCLDDHITGPIAVSGLSSPPPPPPTSKIFGGYNTSELEDATLILPRHPSIDLQTLLKLLPSKADFDALAVRVESAVKKDIHALQKGLAFLSSRVDSMELDYAAIASRIQDLEEHRSDPLPGLSYLHLRVEDLEDRSRRNNVRIRGVPEVIAPTELHEKALEIFSILLADSPALDLKIDRVHRALGTRPHDSQRPRDVICRLHYFSTKEAIVRKAWQTHKIPYEGGFLQILPDMSRNTLRRRALLRPLLGQLREVGATYRWGFPFHLIVRKDNKSFFIRSPADLIQLQDFLNISQIPLPDWTLPFLEEDHKRGQFSQQGRSSPLPLLHLPRNVYYKS